MKKFFKICSMFLGLMAISPSTFANDKIPKDSIFQVSSSWNDQNAKTIQLSNFQGQPIILTMVYLSCPHSCPMTVAKLQEIEKKIVAKGVSKYRFILASFDFENDRPAQMKIFMKKHKLDDSHWSILTGSKDEQIRELAVVLGINYKKLDDGDFSHSNVISLLDEDGRILTKSESLSADDSDLIQKAVKIGGK
jgi:protein SCO1/2